MAEKRRTVRIFKNGGNQAVRIPRELSFQQVELFVWRSGNELIFSAQPMDWSELLEGDAVASSGFMRGPAWEPR